VIHTLRLRGSGRVEVAAYGLADAEHRVEKELHRLWAGCRVDILEVGRPGGGARIVEEFVVRYRVEGSAEVEAESADAAREGALRKVRGGFAGSRFGRIELSIPT